MVGAIEPSVLSLSGKLYYNSYHWAVQYPLSHRLLHFSIFIVAIFVDTVKAQDNQGLVAFFSFNHGSDHDAIHHLKAKLVGTSFAQDRFGNDDHAVYLFGNKYSYINLGSSPHLKQKTTTVSLWAKVENTAYSGWGRFVNPIIITKRSRDVDFYESFSIGYYDETKNAIALCTKDSTREVSISGTEHFDQRKWHHLAITFDNNLFSFYIDGKRINTLRKEFETSYDPLDSVLVGATGSNKNFRFLNAVIDDIRFYNRVLNEEQILALYNEPNPNRQRILLNWVLFALGLLVLVALLIIYVRYRLKKTLEKEKQQLKIQNVVLETELRVNRALMNPHFVFNSLNALQNLILKEEYAGANDYLIKFSRLIRLILENNMSDEISLEHEIDLLKRYLELENLRFKGNISFHIDVAEDVSPAYLKIPVMMIQPFVENSIWHGLLNKPGEKKLSIRFSKSSNTYLLCEIDDNGIGRKKNQGPALKKSLATVFIEQRLSLLNQIHHLNCALSIIDKPNDAGTTVTILLPILTPELHAESHHR